MSKKIKYFKWIRVFKPVEYNAIVRECGKTWNSICFGGMCITWPVSSTLSNWPDSWQEITYSEFRKLKSELLKGKKGN